MRVSFQREFSVSQGNACGIKGMNFGGIMYLFLKTVIPISGIFKNRYGKGRVKVFKMLCTKGKILMRYILEE